MCEEEEAEDFWHEDMGVFKASHQHLKVVEDAQGLVDCERPKKRPEEGYWRRPHGVFEKVGEDPACERSECPILKGHREGGKNEDEEEGVRKYSAGAHASVH